MKGLPLKKIGMTLILAVVAIAIVWRVNPIRKVVLGN